MEKWKPRLNLFMNWWLISPVSCNSIYAYLPQYLSCGPQQWYCRRGDKSKDRENRYKGLGRRVRTWRTNTCIVPHCYRDPRTTCTCCPHPGCWSPTSVVRPLGRRSRQKTECSRRSRSRGRAAEICKAILPTWWQSTGDCWCDQDLGVLL